MTVQAGQVQVGLQLSASQFTKGMQQASHAVNNFVGHVGSAGKQTSIFTSSAVKAGVAVGALTFTLAKFAKQSFGVAADVNEMNVAMEAVGKSTGIGGKAIKDAANKVRSMGIEMKASQEIAMLFVKSNINLAQAHEMARVAQDLAVLSQSNSTETARTLVYAIQTGNSILLKSAGITKYASEAYAQYARELKKSQSALTASERQQAILNMVLKEGKKVAGVYEAAMQEAGKVLRSFPRIINDIQLEFGRLFVDGFGPVILAAYKVTSEFSKMLREGGSLHPVMQSLKEVFNEMVSPLKGVFDNITLALKRINMMKFNTEGLKDTIQKILPSVLALGTALSMLATRNILVSLSRLFPMLSPLAGVIGVGGPIIAGLAVMAALTPEIRDSFMGLVDATKPLVASIQEFTVGLVPVFMQLIDTTTELATNLSGSLVGAVEMVSTAINTVASVVLPFVVTMAELVAFVGQFGIVAEVLAAVLIGKWVLGFIATNKAIITLRTTMVALGAQASAMQFQFAKTFTTMKSMGVSTMASLKMAAKGTFGTIIAGARATAVAVASALAPLIAMTVAVTAAMKIFQAWSDRNKDVEETTKRVNDVIKEQIKLIGGQSDKVIDLLNNQSLLNDIILGTEDSGDKAKAALGQLGIETTMTAETLAALKEDSEGATQAILEQSIGAGEAANKIAELVNTYDKKSPEFFEKKLREMTVTVIENGVAVKKHLTDAQVEAGLAMEELQDQAENLDFAEMRKSLEKSILLYGKYGSKAVKAAQATMEVWQEQNRNATEAEKLAKYQEILAESYEKAAKAAGDYKEATAKIAEENAAKAVYDLNKQLLEGELTADMVKKALFGTAHASLDLAEKLFKADKAFGNVIESVKKSKGDFNKLRTAGSGLVEQIADNTQMIIEMGGSTKDVAVMMQSLIDQFASSAKAAGYSDEQVQGLLDSLGVLASIKNITTTLDVNTQKAKEQLLEYTLIMQRLGGEDKVDSKLSEAISELKRQIDQASKSSNFFDATWKGITDTQKNASGKTATLKQATEMLTKKIKDQKRAVVEAKQALQDYARESTRSIYQAVSVGSVFSRFQASQDKKAAIVERNKQINAQKEADRVAKQREDARKLIDDKNDLIDVENELIQLQNDFADAVGQSVSAVLSFSDVFSQQTSATNEYQQALSQQAEAQQRVTEAQEEYNFMSGEVASIQQQLAQTTGRYARRVLGEELVKAQEDAQKSLEKLTLAQEELTGATDETNKAQEKQITFLQGLEQQATRAAKFGSIIQQLSEAGLSKDALSQIASAGAEIGTTMGEELLAGGIEAISKANKFSKQIIDEGKRVTGLFSETLKERLQYEIYEDKPVYEALGEEVGETFAESLAKQHTKAKEFTEKVKKLISMGLRGKQLEEVLNAGVDAGTDIADALIASGEETIRNSVAIQDELKELSKKFGDELVPYFDQTGVLLAQALLKALQKELKDLPKTLEGKSGKDIYNWIEDFDDKFADKARDIAGGITGTPDTSTASSAAAQQAAASAVRRTDAQLKEAASGFSSFKEAVKALHPNAVAQYTADGSGLNASEIAKLKAQFPRLAATPFATGGIVTKPTLGLVGEAGSEAIIPLNQLGNLGGNSYNITVNAGMGTNGSQVGAQIVEAIKKYEKSNGTRWRS